MSTVADNNKTKSDRLDVINPSKGKRLIFQKKCLILIRSYSG